MAAAEQPRASKSGVILAALALLAGGVWASSVWWLPGIMGRSEPASAGKPPEGGKVLTMIEIGKQARETLGIEVKPLKRSAYERVIPIPARTVVVPGTGRREVTTPSSGTLSKIFVNEGELVAPGQPLFEVKLIHDEGIKTQVELLDALAEKEVVDADLKRLQELEKRTPGAVQGTRILEKRYQQRHLNHVIASRRQMLILLGLPEEDVDRLIVLHIGEVPGEDAEHRDYRRPMLLEKVTIYAPQAAADANGPVRFLMENLAVISGQHLESGDVLCQLGDYQKLYIEGEAFERDLDALRDARDNGWPITAAVERRGGKPLQLTGLKIGYIAPQVDAQSRSARFYVPLENEIRELPAADGQPSRLDWAFRPGQRMELRVPIEQIPAALKVPVEAVARDGLDNYVFQVKGDMFERVPVKVLHRDEEYVVLAEDRRITAGVPIAMNGAYQLQLSLLNKSMDPAAIAHGHAH